MGCGVWGVGCGVWGVGCGVWGVGCGVWGVGCGVSGLGFEGSPQGVSLASPCQAPGPFMQSRSGLARNVRGQTDRLTSRVTSPLQGAEVQNPLFSPLKRGRDPGSQTMCLPPGYPGKACHQDLRRARAGGLHGGRAQPAHTVSSHSGHPTRGCIPRPAWAQVGGLHARLGSWGGHGGRAARKARGGERHTFRGTFKPSNQA